MRGRLNFGTCCVHITECVWMHCVFVLWECLNFGAIFWGARGWHGVTHGTTEQVMNAWLLCATVFTGWILGRLFGVLQQTCNDLYVLFRHTRNSQKTQWFILIHCMCFVHKLECDSRFHANLVFTRLRGPRLMVDAHKLQNGRLREVLYGGNLNAWLLGRIRRRIN